MFGYGQKARGENGDEATDIVRIVIYIYIYIYVNMTLR